MDPEGRGLVPVEPTGMEGGQALRHDRVEAFRDGGTPCVPCGDAMPTRDGVSSPGDALEKVVGCEGDVGLERLAIL
jgi:hypothetical protein